MTTKKIAAKRKPSISGMKLPEVVILWNGSRNDGMLGDLATGFTRHHFSGRNDIIAHLETQASSHDQLSFLVRYSGRRKKRCPGLDLAYAALARRKVRIAGSRLIVRAKTRASPATIRKRN